MRGTALGPYRAAKKLASFLPEVERRKVAFQSVRNEIVLENIMEDSDRLA